MSRESAERDRLESGALRGCLMDGDEQQLTGMRRGRRQAFLVSLAFQIAVVVVVIFVPLFATGERLLLTTVAPRPRFFGIPRGVSRPEPAALAHHNSMTHSIRNVFPAPAQIPPGIFTHDSRPSSPACNACKPGDAKPLTIGDGLPNGIVEPTGIGGPTFPLAIVPIAPKPPALVHRSKMDPAMLIRRVEPRYPPLAIMARREGQVQLRAVIGLDGSIESLRVLAGDPLFIEAAKAAVLQWRYRPTILNGQAVEVDTFVTVIFTLAR